MKNNEKGYTLVELMVATAIGAIVVMVLVGIIRVSLQSFSNTKEQANLQNTMETVLNQLSDELMETKGISISYVNPEDVTGEAEWLFSSEADWSSLYTGVLYRHENSNIYLHRVEQETFSDTLVQIAQEEYLLAQEVESVRVILNDKNGKQITRESTEFENPLTSKLIIQFKNGEEENFLESTVALRNSQSQIIVDSVTVLEK